MKSLLSLTLLALFTVAAQADPLRVFIRGGEANRGPDVHAHPRFLAEWKTLLTERGMKVDGAPTWPTAEQARATDVIVAYAQEGGDATPEQEKVIEEFVKRGGGLVVIHTAAVSRTNPGWWKQITGGAWIDKQTKWKEGPMDLYYTENQRLGGGHPITAGAANFHLDDEIYYDMDVAPEARVLATSYTPKVPAGKKGAEGGKTHIHDIQPQMWAYENGASRVFVSIPGHLFKTFAKPNYRAILLRGIAWAGKRANLDEFSEPKEILSLTYPEGGPQMPAQTLANLEVHPDFTMKLVASEPLISKPMNFDWDPAGRLWVAETPEYPNGRRGMRPDYRGKEWKDHGGIVPEPGEQDRKAIDKISVLTDSDGDGVMDQKQVFYEGLDLVTGLVFHRDGVIVTQAPDILWLRDIDGDGKAEKVEKLYGGLGTGDTHAVINNPRWGWDGWIYATHGYSGSSKVVNAKGEPQGTIGSGVVRFLPDGSKIEQYSSKGGNTWGLTITGDNRVMWTQPTSGTLLNQVVLPESALARGKIGNTSSFHTIIASQKSFPAMKWEQLPYVQIDRVGDFTAGAGCAIYDGGAWPAEYTGDYFTTECTINIIAHQRLTAQGSSFAAAKLPGREETEFVRSKDMWWRPIEVRIGPDGAMYVGDFYNQAVIHNDTRGPDHNRVNAAVRPDRDHYFGRIWKLDHKAAQRTGKAWELGDTKPASGPLNLAKAGSDTLIKHLAHPNAHVRLTASRLLVEHAAAADVQTRNNLRVNFGQHLRTEWPRMNSETRIAGLWTAFRMGEFSPQFLQVAAAKADPAVRRNAALIAEAMATSSPEQPVVSASHAAAASLLGDADAQVRLAALRALGVGAVDDAVARNLVAAWTKLDDDFQRSAAVGALAGNPAAAIAAALDAGDASLAPLVGQLAQGIADRNDTAAAAKLVVALADKPASADALKRSILDTLAKAKGEAPAMTSELSAALGKLLASGVSGSALPLAAKWDKAGALKTQIAAQTDKLLSVLNEADSDEARFAAATNLLGLRTADPRALPAVVKILGGNAKPALQKWIVVALGEVGDPAAGAAIVSAYAKLPADAQQAAFDVLLKRTDSALALLDAIKAKTLDVSGVGPANLARLRTHPNKEVATRSGAVLDELLGPAMKAKNEVIAKLSAVVEKPGNAANGKTLFASACAICHKLGELGTDIGPGLTGMGTHGPAELLTAIVDPNREVDPSFVTWNLETNDGQLYSGVIASENPASITLKSLAGVQEVKVANIKTRVNTGRSLMPEGLEGLGGEMLRDIIAYMQAESGGKFRTLDLSKAFTASSGRGLYLDENNPRDGLKFAKTGHVTVEGVPFNIVAPSRAAANLIQLKGGPEKSFSRTMPERVEVPVGGFKANRLHFLGGVGGWAHPYNDDQMVVMKVTAHTADGQRQTFDLKNGVEFADYIREVEVPGSKLTRGLVKENQLRWFTLRLASAAGIEKLTLESLSTGVAPTTVAITAELADANAPTPVTAPAPAAAAAGDLKIAPEFNAPVPQPPASAKGPRVLLVGGGSAHDFPKFFGEADKAILAPHVGWVDFTMNANAVPSVLANVDLLVWSANQPLSAATRTALMDWVKAGKPLIVLHPGLWFNWKNFTEWNREVCGGGSGGHDRLGEFEVAVTNRAHPLTAGLPEKFRITDELYYFVPDEKGTPLEVLATATSTQKPGTYPQLFIVKHPKAKIVGLTLGHDGRAHDLPEFRTMLKNAVKWTTDAK